jgi:dipeptidyl-peptidase 4
MLRTLLALLILAIFGAQVFAQPITLDDVWGRNAFKTEGVRGLRSMKDGKHYTALSGAETDRTVVKFAYKTGEEVERLITAAELRFNQQALKIEEYAFNGDETKLLIGTEPQKLYRHSSSHVWYVFDLLTRTMRQLADGQQVFHATFSPGSDRVAYVKDNDLWVERIDSGEMMRLTSNGRKNTIINGMADWVYEEEFAFTQAFEWSPDGTYIAYYEFNEEQIKEFTMMRYGGLLYPEKETFKYPKAGEANSIVNIYIVNPATGERVKVDIGTETDIYIPRIKWTLDPQVLSVQRLNRLQNKWELLLANASDGKTSPILTEESKTYIDINDDLTFLTGGKQFIIRSERDGYSHLYLYNMDGSPVMQLTSGKWDVTAFYGVDEKGKDLFYQSSEEGPSQRHVYSASLNGKWKRKLTPDKGQNDADFSAGMTYFINRHSTADSPPVTSLLDSKGKLTRVLKDNKRLANQLLGMKLPKKDFFTFTPSHGTPLNGWILKPAGLKEGEQLPVVIHIYGGPGSNYVNDSWEGQKLMWHHMLVQQGFIVVSVDNRGTGNRGRDFKHSTYMELGKLEAEDYIETAKYLGTLPYVDKDRIGIYGWSYGGYMSSLAITKGADHFKAAVAVAPVTNWRFYDSIYTERFMRTPQENPNGYDDNSPVNHVEKLRGSYLLVHGSADDNVHFQNSMAMIDALVAANKPFDLMVYPDLDHAIYGHNSRLHLYTKITDFLKKNL